MPIEDAELLDELEMRADVEALRQARAVGPTTLLLEILPARYGSRRLRRGVIPGVIISLEYIFGKRVYRMC